MQQWKMKDYFYGVNVIQNTFQMRGTMIPVVSCPEPWTGEDFYFDPRNRLCNCCKLFIQLFIFVQTGPPQPFILKSWISNVSIRRPILTICQKALFSF